MFAFCDYNKSEVTPHGFDVDFSEGWQCWSFHSQMRWPFVRLVLQTSVYSCISASLWNQVLWGDILLLCFLGSLCILDVSPLSVVQFANVSPFSVYCQRSYKQPSPNNLYKREENQMVGGCDPLSEGGVSWRVLWVKVLRVTSCFNKPF